MKTIPYIIALTIIITIASIITSQRTINTLNSKIEIQQIIIDSTNYELNVSKIEIQSLQNELDTKIYSDSAIYVIRELEIDNYRNEEQIQRLYNEISELNSELRSEYERLKRKYER